MSIGEVACSYSLMILHDDNIAVTGEKISTLLKAANINVEAYWPSLFAKLAEKKNLDDLILNAAGGGAPVSVSAPVAAAASTAVAAPTEEKKEEPKDESDDDMGFSLFD